MRTNQQPTVVRFYHPQRLAIEQAVAVVVEKAYQRRMAVCLLGDDPAFLNHLDRLLWLYPANSFLPHGLAGGTEDARQPILLALTPNDCNGATVIANLCGWRIAPAPPALDRLQPLPHPEAFDMVLEFVDASRNETVAAARQNYRRYRDMAATRPLQLEYWSQSAQGEWEKKGA
jgi:DNA polymerase-3 subunit chi